MSDEWKKQLILFKYRTEHRARMPGVFVSRPRCVHRARNVKPFVDSGWRGLGFNDWINEARTLERGEAFDPDTNNRRPYLPEMFFSQHSAVAVKFLLADNPEVNIGFGREKIVHFG